MHVKSYLSQVYGEDEFNHILHSISSLIDDFSFKVRNTRYQGSILKGPSETTACKDST